MAVDPACVARAAEEILAYLGAHPSAADSLDGIRQWWLPAQLPCKDAELALAVEQLVQAGRLERVQLAGSGDVYRAPRRR